jgi:NADH:ubiquinone oxidoreductase subunit 3 (subunit A)
MDINDDYDSEVKIDEQLTLTTINQAWFKLLAVICFFCAIFVNAAVIWLLVCRAQRLRPTDYQIKRNAAYSTHKWQRKKECYKRKLVYLLTRLQYVVFGESVKNKPENTDDSSS